MKATRITNNQGNVTPQKGGKALVINRKEMELLSISNSLLFQTVTLSQLYVFQFQFKRLLLFNAE